jgi:hypothetical protein
MGKGFWLDLSFLFDSVHVDPVSELFFPDIFVSPALAVDEMRRGVYSVITSVAKPGRPRYMRPVMGKIYEPLSQGEMQE